MPARKLADEICAYFGDTKLAMNGYANTNGVVAIISRFLAVPVSDENKIEQVITCWRTQLTDSSFVSDEDAEDLTLRMLALFGAAKNDNAASAVLQRETPR